LLAIDHYNEALPAGYKDMVRKLAGWTPSNNGDHYALTLSGSP
jgi:hypothetical protein